MELERIIAELESIAPTRYAEAWDNVGLLVGDAKQVISRGMLCIDYTPEVACEAAGANCDLVIAYHPPIFSAVKRIVAPSAAFDAIKRGVAIYSPHTALDVATGGTNDMLADALGMNADTRRPLRLSEAKASQYKLVTFVPADAVDRVASALFDAGAGRIGDYSQCSFRSAGTGTFFGEAGTNPAVGQKGKLERADEIRLETVIPIARAAEIVSALRQSHPYEEPAFDLVQLAAAPEGIGQGRIGPITKIDRGELFEQIKRELALSHLLIAGPQTGSIERVACCAGSCGEFLGDALAQKAELFLTGELRHHDALKAANAGMTVVCTLHSNSERAVLKRLMSRLAERIPQVALQLSRLDRDPFSVR